jgi:hypothetical protein
MAARKRQRLADVLGGAILIAAYGAAGAFTASLVEDPQDLRRHLVLSGTSFAVLFAVLLPLLLSIEPSNTGERVKADVRARLTAHDEGRGRWRQLSHARQEAAGWRIDMHDLTDVEGVVATVVDLLKLMVGEGSARSKDPTLRPRVEAALRAAFPTSRIRHGRKSISTIPDAAVQGGGGLKLPVMLMTLSLVFVALLLLR